MKRDEAHVRDMTGRTQEARQLSLFAAEEP
jgi:hypothetical protein